MPKLTVVGINRLTKPGRYGDGRGLWLQVSKSGTKSWLLRYMLEGRARAMGLGSYPEVTLATAREKALAYRQLLKNPDNRQDPLELRKSKELAARLQAARSHTFKDCTDGFLDTKRAGWNNKKSEAQWRSSLETYAIPKIGDLPVDQIRVEHIIEVLKPIWSEKNETASRVRGRIEAVLDWSRVAGYRIGENPARWKGHLDKLLPRPSKVQKREHHAALPFRELPVFLSSVRKQRGTAARALELTILTACRTNEVTNATWPEFDFETAVWTIPASRMKGGRQHEVPLSTAALTLLQEMRQLGSDCVFPTSNLKVPISNNAMLALLKRMERTDITVHGFRSSFRDWAGETTTYPREVVEHALAHRVGDQAEQAYARGTLLPKRKTLMQDWADFCRT